VKLKLAIDPDIVALMAAEVAAGERAVTAAMREAGTSLKSAWRTQITGAGLGTRLSASLIPASLSLAALHVPATISGWRNTMRIWSMTAASISPAGTRLTGHDPAPCFRTVWLT
jgi:hypothetical protein